MSKHTKYNHKIKGFTLIELMIAVAIVGVLSAVALPAYQDYVVKSQVSEGLSLAGGAKIYINDFYSQKGRLPETSAEATLPSTTGSFVADLKIEDSIVKITFNQNANSILIDKEVDMTPIITGNNNIKFECSSTLPKKYLPANCH